MNEPRTILTERLDEAFAFAHELHREQRRKGSRVPYITHLMSVAALVGEYGGDEDQMVAALLHDAVEDQGGRSTLDAIRERFGERVAGYVIQCSDAETEPKPPWRARKEAFADSVRAAPPEIKLLVAADKLHNARATIVDLDNEGPGVWQRFRGGRMGTLWYYDLMLEALEDGWSHPILRELRECVRTLHEAAGETERA